MGIFSFIKKADINAGAEQFRKTPGAVLLDVRTPEEYGEGHIPGSVNLPLQRITDAEKRFPDRKTPLFTYCYSGSRSSQAESWLKAAGYSNVTNIGGISRYSGKSEK